MESKNSVWESYFLVAVLGVIFLVSGFYYFKHRQVSEKSLTPSERTVHTESIKLENLQKRQKMEANVIADLQKQYSSASGGVLGLTDALFRNAQSQDPKILIKIKDKNLEKTINEKRKEITKRINDWDKLLESLNLESLNTEKSDESIYITLTDLAVISGNDILYIQEYLQMLQNIVGDLTPVNSNLTESQIESYQSIVATNLLQVNEVIAQSKEVISYIETVYEPTVTFMSNNSSPQENNEAVVSSNASTQGEGEPVPSQSNPVSVPPLVTSEQIQAQETVVAQAEANQNAIENQTNGTEFSNTDGSYQNPNDQAPEYATPSPYLPPSSPPPETIIEYLQNLPSPYTNPDWWPDVSPTSLKPELLQGQ